MKLAVLQKHWRSGAPLEPPKLLPGFETLVTQSRLEFSLRIGVVAWVQGLV